MADPRLDELEARYRETSNPIYLWKVIANYELFPPGTPLPSWVEAYLREVAMVLELMADAAAPATAVQKTTQALGLTQRGKNAFASYQVDVRVGNAAFFMDARQDLKESKKQIKAWIADRYGVKSRAVEGWLTRSERQKKQRKPPV